MTSTYRGDTSSWFTERFKAYSRRITTISLIHPDESLSLILDGRYYHVDESLFTAWMHSPGGLEAVFPRLRRFDYTDRGDTDYYISIAMNIIPIGLHAINAKIIDDPRSDIHVYDRFLRLVTPHTSNLRRLTLYNYSIGIRSVLADNAFSELIMHTPKLQELRTNILLSQDAILHLGYLPSLKVFCDEALMDVQAASIQPDCSFQKLEKLHLHSTYSNMTQIISKIASHTVNSIELRISGRYSVEDFLSFLSICAKHADLEYVSATERTLVLFQTLHVKDVERIIIILQIMTTLRSLDVGSFIFPILDSSLASRLLDAFPCNFRCLKSYYLSPVPWQVLYRTLSARIWEDIPFGLYFEPVVPSQISFDRRFAQESVRVLHVAGNPGSAESRREWAYILRFVFPNLRGMLVNPAEQHPVNKTSISAVSDLMRINYRTNWRMAQYDIYG
jgi:hypothetical protein